AKNTTAMIEQSVSSARQGVTLADDVVKGFERINTLTASAQAVVTEIAASTQERAQGITQVNQTVASLDKLTQEGAAQAEEAAAARAELSSQSVQRRQVVVDLQKLLHGRAQADTLARAA